MSTAIGVANLDSQNLLLFSKDFREDTEFGPQTSFRHVTHQSLSIRVRLLLNHKVARRWGTAVCREAIDQTHLLARDLIVLDIGMPIMDGIEAAITIKSDPITCHNPVGAMMAHRGPDPEIRRLYFTGLLDKPVYLENLQLTVSSTLSQTEHAPV